jgi:hypothetical protein
MKNGMLSLKSKAINALPAELPIPAQLKVGTSIIATKTATFEGFFVRLATSLLVK